MHAWPIQFTVARMFITVLFTRSSDVQNSSSASQRRQGHRRAHAKPAHTTSTVLPQVAFVDLVDSDDDNGGDVEEVDLELKL